jgi:medium-chain acyl-[acyl-carrier-protein] hydrolase
MPPSPWFWTPESNGRARIRLLCLPFAGGGPSAFGQWPRELPPEVALWGVRLPGRDARWREAPFTSIQAIVSAVAGELATNPVQTPYAIFGHSLGALVGFELVRELRRRRMPLPSVILAAGRGAPQIPLRASNFHALPDDQFIAAIVARYDGIPKVVLEDRELLQLYLTPMRADITAHETYVYRDEPPLDVPLVAIGGLDDHTVVFDDLAAWRAQTSASFHVELIPGGHFFLSDQRAQLIALLRRRLAEYYA